MENSPQNGKDAQDDFWSPQTGKDRANEIEDSSEEEQSRIQEAMFEWKKKGNDQLASACADALEIGNQLEEPFTPDDPFTEKLKTEVERLEAEEAVKKDLSSAEEATTSYISESNELDLFANVSRTPEEKFYEPIIQTSNNEQKK